ncbi:glycosyltransferase [Alicyclobacillus sp. SO9]|uniref:MGDG synthase family glycosyltransferase n=1 Tax=Alicyclobacillus sp. SO9 TaxID=2665646 RepID=UPI0018E7CF46|nr:glycosyltransferase [Alicyclobacillus sp. SO9]QQE78783.1 UDP-N-acetylglucosamine 2-epimerase [Alicyclobacillus sp. SO9]
MAQLSKLLILSAAYGEGHQQAAYAVRDALSLQSPETEVVIVDFVRMVHPLLDSVARYCYLKSVQFAPLLWDWFYKGTSNLSPSSMIQKKLNSVGIHALERLLTESNPDVVLSTFPIPAGVVSFLKQLRRTQVPLATIITDHAIHSQWIHPLTTRYFVGSDHVRQGLIRRGTSRSNISVTGIPIRPAFDAAYDRKSLQEKYGLDKNLPTVLVMGGAYGIMGDINLICEELFNYPKPVQVIVVTGRNDRMKAQIDGLVANAKQTVKVYGFTQDVHELMGVSDIVLTKAGGLTISEALAMELPMLLYRPIPGQEVQNADYLVSAGVAVLAETRPQVTDALRDLLVENPQKREKMRHMTRLIRRRNAAGKIAAELMNMADAVEVQAQYSFPG